MTMNKALYTTIVGYLRDIIIGTEYENNVLVCGGAVRDDIMGNPIKDIDICVTMPNGGINFARFLHERSYLTHEPVVYPTYGTAMFVLKEFPYAEIEVVQTRKEQYKNKNSRNPEVVFGTLEDDCRRRDLTINSMYYDITNEKYIDMTGMGMSDIRNHIIRATNDTDIIFSDDALRILRCVRFKCRYGWEIEGNTFDGMRKNVGRLITITHERIQDELNKMLLSENPTQAFETLYEIGALKYVMAELETIHDMEQNKYHFGTVWQHTMKVLEIVSSQSDSLTLRMAALLHDMGKVSTKTIDENGGVHFYHHESMTDMVTDMLKRLKYPNSFIKDVVFLVKNHMITKQWGDDCGKMKPRSLRKLQYRCGRKYFNDLLCLIDADNKAHAEGYCMPNQVNNIIAASYMMETDGTDMLDYHLPIDGNDIMSCRGIGPGEDVKACMDYALKLAYNNPLITKDLLLKHIKSYRIPNK